jgi:hypothetical protein
MSLIPASNPMPYSPIRIIDISAQRSSIRTRAAASRRSRIRSRVASAVAAFVAVVAIAAAAGAAPVTGPAAGDFRLSPGNGVPASLAGSVSVAADAAGDFRLSPGNGVPAPLAVVGVSMPAADVTSAVGGGARRAIR